jgi:hypothetical protein
MGDMNRDDFTELFVDVLKICEPEHPYYSEDPYDDVTTDDIVTTFCREDSVYYARCGPRHSPNVAKYAVDLGYYQDVSFARVLSITVHEVTHIPYGTHNGFRSPAHPPEFWNEMAYHSQCVLDHLPQIEEKWMEVDEEQFRKEIVNDPNASMVDRRSESVADVRERLRNWVSEYEAGI